MNRRTACQTAAAGLVAGLAGCTRFERPFEEESTNGEEIHPDDDPNEDETTDKETEESDAIDSDRVVGASFSHTGGCSDPETAAIEFLDSVPEALITGCIEGHNGCAVPVLVGGRDENNTLHIEVGEADFSDPDTVCTQEITRLGYELRLRFDPELPETIEVFHDGAIEQGIVAAASR